MHFAFSQKNKYICIDFSETLCIFAQNHYTETMKTTLDTIAGNTGFAKSTISRVLNGKAGSSRISRQTVELIRREAERCGYTPNILAKNLRLHSSQTIGLLVPSIANPYFADIASVIISEARRLGYTTIVADTMENAEVQNSSVTTLLHRQVDGIIIVPCDDDPTFLEQTNSHCIPIILVDRYYETSELPYVVTNNFRGGYDATSSLYETGIEISHVYRAPHQPVRIKKELKDISLH